MNPYVTDPSLYGQYYTMGQNPHGGHHGAYAAYYNAAAYASAHNSAAAAHAVATVTGQPPVTAAAVPGYATTNSAQIVPQVNHNPQNALTTIHPEQSRNSSKNAMNVVDVNPSSIVNNGRVYFREEDNESKKSFYDAINMESVKEIITFKVRKIGHDYV